MVLSTRFKNPRVVKLVFNSFLLFSFFVFFGDAIMSYATPVFLDQKINDTLLFGIVFSSSSVIGLIFDFLGGEKFGNKSFGFFFKITIIAAITFPLILLLFPSSIIGYFLALAAWGIYYETHAFANFRFIESTKKREEFSETWSLVLTISAIAYFAGPLIASYLINYFVELNFYVAMFLYFVAFISYKSIRARVKDEDRAEETKKEGVSVWIEVRRWLTLLNHLWPLWSVGVVMIVVESFFWTIGIVYVENLKEISPLAGFMISIYMIPTIIIGGIMSRIQIKSGKKRLLLAFSLVAGLLLSRFGYAASVPGTLVIIVLYSVFSSVAFNLLHATYEDYTARSGKFENDLIGLEQSASSFAYVLGPLLAGGLAGLVGEKLAISYVGIALAAAALIGFFVVPRKILIPHESLEQIS